MTTFADLVASTITVTKRPDLTSEVTLALKKAIIKEHSAFDYPRDLANLQVALTQPVAANNRYTLSLATLGLYPALRKISLIQEIPDIVEPAISSVQNNALIFKEKKHDNVFNTYGQEINQYYYRLGSSINIVAPRQVDNINIVYYGLPDLSNTATYSDWLADMFDYVIYTSAAAEIFRIIGKSAEQKMQLQMLADNRMDVIKSEISEVG